MQHVYANDVAEAILQGVADTITASFICESLNVQQYCRESVCIMYRRPIGADKSMYISPKKENWAGVEWHLVKPLKQLFTSFRHPREGGDPVNIVRLV